MLHAIAANHLGSRWSAVLRLTAVICCCLSTLGIGYSTVLAQSIPAVSPAPVISGRRGMGASQPDSEDADAHGVGDHRPIAASYSRYSSDLQNDSSIEDQRRLSRQLAEDKGYHLPPEMEYADHAVSGTKLQREGLDRLLDDAKQGRFSLLIVHSLSRLARESIIGMPILKKLVCEYGIRFISVSESIDSESPSWVMMATMYLLQHENYVEELGKNVHRGQEGTVLDGFSVGDHRFGYRSIPSPGGEMIGRGRNAKPRMVYQIDPVQAEWVKNIFSWFVSEGRSISWIFGELNRRNAPKDHRSTTPNWRHELVTNLMKSPKYIGVWPWSEKKNKRIPSTGRVFQVPRPESETRRWLRQIPELRLISDEVFFAAQELLQKNAEKAGQKRNEDGELSGRVVDRNYQHLLAGLLKCKQCGSIFHTSGAGSKYMSCSGYKSRTCTCSTMVPRELTQKLILQTVSSAIRSNPVWIQQIVDLTQQAIDALVRDEPSRRAQLEQELKSIEHKINRLLDMAETSDDVGIAARLAQRRLEKAGLQRELRELERTNSDVPKTASADWVTQQIDRLDEVLKSGTPAATETLQKLLDGPILMEVVPHEDRKRPHLRGTFRIRVGRIRVDRASEIPRIESSTADHGDVLEEITIDFCKPTKTEEQAEIAWKLYREQRPINEIAEVLQVSRARMTAILDFAAAKHGEERVDGRQRRSTLPESTRAPTIGDLKSDEVMRMYHENMLLSEIADRLKIDRNTVTAVVAKWHERQGLPVPDGRTRRKDLEIKNKSASEDDPASSLTSEQSESEQT
jgi:site-specific DNA recombinase